MIAAAIKFCEYLTHLAVSLVNATTLATPTATERTEERRSNHAKQQRQLVRERLERRKRQFGRVSWWLVPNGNRPSSLFHPR